MRIYLNDRGMDAADGTDALAAIRGADPDLANQVESGKAYITDARALRLDPATRLSAGDVLRVIRRPPRDEEPGDADT